MAEQIAVRGGGIPPIPAGAVESVHSRDLPQGQHQAPPSHLQVPGFVPPAPAYVAPAAAPAPEAAAQPGGDPALQQLLQALQGLQPAAAAPTQNQPAAQPLPTPPQGSGTDGALRGILAGSGVDVERAIAAALEYGDVNLIDRRYITEAGGANAQYLMQIAEGIVSSRADDDNRMAESIYAAAGGKANWNSALHEFTSKAPSHIQTIVQSLYDSRNPKSIEAANQTVLTYGQGAGVTLNPAQTIQGGAGAGAAQALDKVQFQAELQKLNKNAQGYEQARAELFSRRSIGKSLGR